MKLIKELILAAVISFASGCGPDCEHPEQIYRITDQIYTPKYEEPISHNVNLELLEGKISLEKYRPENYYEPGFYKVRCQMNLGDYLFESPFDQGFEYYIVKITSDKEELESEDWELIGYNNGWEKQYFESRAITLEEMAEVEKFKCNIFLPAKKDVVYENNLGGEDIIVDYPEVHVGEVKANIKAGEPFCNDDDEYYDNPLHE